jgi:hypothetical protein
LESIATAIIFFFDAVYVAGKVSALELQLVFVAIWVLGLANRKLDNSVPGEQLAWPRFCPRDPWTIGVIVPRVRLAYAYHGVWPIRLSTGLRRCLRIRASGTNSLAIGKACHHSQTLGD